MAESLLLKWGTLKGWEVETEESRAALKKYFDAGENSGSAMLQRDNSEQKLALCELIDAIKAETVGNDWEGTEMTKQEAKDYVMNYGRPS